MSTANARNLANTAINTAAWAYGSRDVGRQEIENLANAVRQVAMAVIDLAQEIDELGQRFR